MVVVGNFNIAYLLNQIVIGCATVCGNFFICQLNCSFLTLGLCLYVYSIGKRFNSGCLNMIIALAPKMRHVDTCTQLLCRKNSPQRLTPVLKPLTKTRAAEHTHYGWVVATNWFQQWKQKKVLVLNSILRCVHVPIVLGLSGVFKSSSDSSVGSPFTKAFRREWSKTTWSAMVVLRPAEWRSCLTESAHLSCFGRWHLGLF